MFQSVTRLVPHAPSHELYGFDNEVEVSRNAADTRSAWHFTARRFYDVQRLLSSGFAPLIGLRTPVYYHFRLRQTPNQLKAAFRAKGLDRKNTFMQFTASDTREAPELNLAKPRELGLQKCRRLSDPALARTVADEGVRFRSE